MSMRGPAGDWKVSIFGSQANNRWEMRIAGLNAFERTYTLEGTAGEHEAQTIATIVAKMIPQLSPASEHETSNRTLATEVLFESAHQTFIRDRRGAARICAP